MPEFESINKAFFKKKENLDKFQLAIQEGTLLSDHNIRIEQLDRLRIGEIKDLWDALNSHHLAKSTHFKNHFFSFTFDERFSKLQKKKNLVIFIALQGDRKCGYCVASVDDNVGEVDSIYVMEAQRGASIGIVLFLKAIDWLHDRDCWLINVAIAEGNEDVISFYERFGFKRRYTVLQKRFPLSE